MERGSIPCALPLRLLGHTGTAVCFHANAQMNGSIRAPAHARENSYIRACARALRGCVRVLCVLLMLFHLGVCALASGRSYSEQQSFLSERCSVEKSSSSWAVAWVYLPSPVR